MGAWMMALGGWAFNSELVRRLSPFQFIGWFVVSFFITVFVEARVLTRRWSRRGESAGVSPQTVAWVLNGVSYVGLATILAVMYVRCT